MEPFLNALKERRLLFDGSMGSLLGAMGYASECPELLNVEAPGVIQGVHAHYMEAGAQVIITNSLGTTPIKLARAGLSGRAAELTRAAVKNALEAAQHRAYVALDVGPTGEFMAPLGERTLDEMVAAFSLVCEAGAQAGANLILLETMTDIAEARAACLAARRTGLPVAASFTFESNGRTLTGGSPECAALTLWAAGASALGVNCSGGPEQMLSPLAAMRRACPLPVVIQPNAGMPAVDAEGHVHYPFSPEDMVPWMARILEAGASAIGGCCGTTPAHIAAFSRLSLASPAVPAWDGQARVCSGRTALPVTVAQSGAVDVSEPDELYDLEPEDSAALVDLAGLTPQEAGALVEEAQSITSKPLLFAAGSPEALEQALYRYAGVAGVYAAPELQPVLSRYGAVRLDR